MIKTFMAIKCNIPTASSVSHGYVEIVSAPCPPWEQPKTFEQACEEARAAGLWVKGEGNG